MSTTDQPAKIFMGIASRTSPELASFDIPQLSEIFMKENIYEKIPHKVSPEVIVLYCDYEGDYTKPYTVLMGCEISPTNEIPEGLTVKSIPAGQYTKFIAKGEFPQKLIETWQHIWELKDLKRTYTGDYEVYGQKFHQDPKEIDIYIAVKS